MGPIAVGAIGAGISAVTSGLSGAFGAKLNFRQTRNLMKYQNEMNQQNWMMQNEYNLPVNQMSRLMDAGINPALIGADGSQMAEGINTSNPASVGSSLPDLGSSAAQGFGQAQSVLESASRTSLNKTNEYYTAALGDGNIELNGINIETGKITNEQLRERLAAQLAKTQVETDAVSEGLRQRWSQLDLEGRQVAVQEALADIDVKLKNQQWSQNEAMFILLMLEKQTGIRLTNEMIKTEQTKQGLNSSQTGLNISLRNQADVNTATARAENALQYGDDYATDPQGGYADTRYSRELLKLLADIKYQQGKALYVDDPTQIDQWLRAYLMFQQGLLSGSAGVSMMVK